MANTKKTRGVIAILTGGGDVPGLNPAIRAITIRANREGFTVLGLRRGWAGITELVRDKKADNSKSYMVLTNDIVNKAGRSPIFLLNKKAFVPYNFCLMMKPSLVWQIL